jgi:hypothetical protein
MPTEIAVLRAALKSNPEGHARLREMAVAGKIGSFDEINPAEPLTVVAASEHFGVTGAIQAKCECGTVVWLSPSTQAMMKGRGDAPTQIICVLCFSRTMQSDREEKVKN